MISVSALPITKILLLLVVAVVLVLTFLHWDSIFTRLQETYYSLLYPVPVKSKLSRIDDVVIDSTLLGSRQRHAKVYIPKAYDIEVGRHFPTLYLLHGYPGSYKDWLINAHLQTTLDNLIEDKTLPPVIVVFPDGNGPVVRDSQYVDATAVDQPMESHFIKEVVPFIDSHYRTKKDRRFRAIGGISSGAYGAVNIALRNPGLFGFTMSHSGYFYNVEPATSELFDHDTNAIDANSPLRYVAARKTEELPYLYFDIGRSDTFGHFIEQNKRFDELLNKENIPHEFRLTEGWHDWNVWAKNIEVSLSAWGRYMKGVEVSHEARRG